MTEAELKGVVIAMAHERGWMVFHLPNRPQTNSGNGYPDLTLARDGEVLWLELKTQTGTLSIEQVAWSMALPSNSRLVTEGMDVRGWIHYEVIRPSDLARGRVDELLA